MSDKENETRSGSYRSEGEDRSAHEEGSIRQSASRSRSRSRTPSRPRSGSRPRSSGGYRKHSRSRSRSHGRKHYRSRSRSYSPYHHKRKRYYSRSRSRSYSPGYRRSPGYHGSYHGSRYEGRRRTYHRSHSRSPMSNRRRHAGDRVRQRKWREVHSRDDPKTSRCIGVFGLSLSTQERDLYDHFDRYGRVEDIQLVYDRQTGRSRGFAFIYFRNLDDAVDAKENAPGSEIDGRRIRVDYSITERAHTPTPGIYLGKPTSSGMSRSRRSPSPYYRESRRSRYSYSRSRSRSYSPRLEDKVVKCLKNET